MAAPVADKAKGCYRKRHLEPESNLRKPQSQHGRVLRLRENERRKKKKGCDYVGYNQKSKYIKSKALG